MAFVGSCFFCIFANMKPQQQLIRLTCFASTLMLLLGIFGCANRGAGPQGGPKDTVPPKVVSCTPVNGALHVTSKTFDIEFDELVNVNNAARCVPTIDDRVTNGLKSSQRPLLSTFIGSLKSAITKYAHECKLEFAWQSRYHDHYIRGVEDMNHISQYIEGNVLHWEKDCFYL